MPNDERFYEQTEEEIQDNKKLRIQNAVTNLPTKYWILMFIIGIILILLFWQGQIGIWHVVIIMLVLITVLLMGNETLNIKRQHSQPEVMKIIRETVLTEMHNRTISFPDGKLIVSPVVKPEETIKGDTTICRNIRGGFQIITGSRNVHNYVALVHPTEPRVMGIEERILSYRGTETVPIKLIIPAEHKFLQSFLRRRM